MGKAKSAVIECRADVRSLATLLRYYWNSPRITAGGVPRTKSGLVSAAVEDLTTILVYNNLVKRETSTEEAIKYLERYGMSNVNPRGRGHKEVLKQLEIERPTVEDDILKDVLEEMDDEDS